MIYNFETAEENAKDLEGWLGEPDRKALYKYTTKSSPKECIVEVGSWGGKSLTYLTYSILEQKSPCKVYSIDPFLTSKDEPNNMYEKFIENIKKVKIYDRIKHIKEKSQEVGKNWTEPISFIFIDGFHKYDWVKKDFELFFPHIITNGYCALHDVGSYLGPTKLIEEIVDTTDNFKIIGLFGITLIAQKVEKLSTEDKNFNKQIIAQLHKTIDYDSLIS